jgi:hypothetical protein
LIFRECAKDSGSRRTTRQQPDAIPCPFRDANLRKPCAKASHRTGATHPAAAKQKAPLEAGLFSRCLPPISPESR